MADTTKSEPLVDGRPSGGRGRVESTARSGGGGRDGIPQGTLDILERLDKADDRR